MAPRSRPRPGKTPARGDEQKRLRIATEAARIMAEEGVRDYQTAKRKAAERLNFPDTRHLPANDEIEAALSQRLQLFHGDDLARNTRRLREIAAQAMRFLSDFEPRLVGGVLSGTVTDASEIQLHLRADAPEQIGFFLQEHQIPYDQGERRIRADRLAVGGEHRPVLRLEHVGEGRRARVAARAAVGPERRLHSVCSG